MDSSLYKRQIVQQHNPKDYYRSLDILSREVSEQSSEETEKTSFLSTFLFCSNFASISPRISHSKYIPMIPRKDILLEMHRNTAPNNQQQEKETEDDMGCASCFRWIHVVTGYSLHPKVEQMVEHFVLDFDIFSGCWSYDFSWLLLDRPVF